MSGVPFVPPAQKYRLDVAPNNRVADGSPLVGVAGGSEQSLQQGSPLHPHSPLFAFGVLAALTFGLMAVSATARVGHTRVGVNVGST